MKKIYLLLIVLFFAIQGKAQVPTCSLDPTFLAMPKAGVWPDSVTNFISGSVGQPYVQNITVKVPDDTIQAIIKFCFTRFVLYTPTVATNYNLPPGLNFGSSTGSVVSGQVNGAPSFTFPAKANNCASIYGTPTTAGSYTLKLAVDAYATSTTLIGSCPTVPNYSGGLKINTSNLGYYIINILPPAGINELVSSSSLNLQNSPNPFSDKTTIKFNVQDEKPYTFTVYDMLGSIVHSETHRTRLGENSLDFNAGKLSKGIYFYSITYKGYSETKRMIVTEN